MGPQGQNFKAFILLYFTFFSYFQNKVTEPRGEKFGGSCFLMKILGTPLDELAPTGENPWRRP